MTGFNLNFDDDGQVSTGMGDDKILQLESFTGGKVLAIGQNLMGITAVNIDSSKRILASTKNIKDDLVSVFRLTGNGILDSFFSTNKELQLPSRINYFTQSWAATLRVDNRLFSGGNHDNNNIVVSKQSIGSSSLPASPKIFTIATLATDAEILANFLGVTTGLSNITLKTIGDKKAIGSFKDDPLNLGKGIVLSTGQVSQLVGANSNDQSNISTDFGLSGTLPSGRDAISLEITFKADADAKQIFFQYVFGSEEFLDFSGSQFNDIFTFELNGVNLAKLSDGRIANINNLTPSSSPSSFSPDYISNLVSTNPANSKIVLDGYTKPLRFVGDLITGATNKLVITIQDISDGGLDSAVFLKGGTLGVVNPGDLNTGSGLNLIGVNNLDVGSTNSRGPFATNPRNITLTGNEINLIGGGDSVVSPLKDLTIQPFDLTQNIRIGSTDSGSSSILDITSTDLAAIGNGFRKIIIGRANGSGTISIIAPVSFRDPILLQSPNGQININAPIILTDNATLDFNIKTLVKSGSSILTISGSTATTFIGSTIVNGGTLELAKTSGIDALNNAPITINSGILKLKNSEQINNAADLTLKGGSFNLNGFNENLDLLKISSNSVIDFGNSSSDLVFGNSSSQAWQGILTIQNWSSTTGEKLRFGNNANGLTATQLQSIQFAGLSRGAKIDSTGFVTPISNSTSSIVTAALNNRSASVLGNQPNKLLDLRSFSANQNISVTFTVTQEAAFNNTVGFYQIEDAQGTVTSITGAKLQPSQAGYRAAVSQNKIAGLDLSVADGQTLSVTKTLHGGVLYAPFLISKTHPNNLNNNFSNLYTPYLLGNGDAADHVKLLGHNTFGFEEIVGNGDQDFNDLVVKTVFTIN